LSDFYLSKKKEIPAACLEREGILRKETHQLPGRRLKANADLAEFKYRPEFMSGFYFSILPVFGRICIDISLVHDTLKVFGIRFGKGPRPAILFL
jgi:hypothetical protein